MFKGARSLSRLIPIKYHNKRYPPHISSNIQEVAGHFDKGQVYINTPYSLHTEYSYASRKLNSNVLNGLDAIRNAHKDFIPQLWKSADWAIEFAIFIKRLVDKKLPPEIIEIHPPFDDYCETFEQFIEMYMCFYEEISATFPDVKIFIENRCGTQYRGGKFLMSTGSDILKLCKIIKQNELELSIVLDYPQLFTAQKIGMNNIDLAPIIDFNTRLVEYRDVVDGIHIWGRRKNSKGRWITHVGDLNSYFDNNQVLKNKFLLSLYHTFDDDNKRYFVPEVNSGEEDLFSIVSDLESAGFKMM